ncbi:Type III restriction enzyme, res subunit, partial [Desulfacinum hydrothermale DSM 13146]
MVGSLKEFLAEYGNMLLTNVSRSQPLYSPDAEGAFEAAMRERLTKLLRTPFPKQAEAVLALTKGFKVRKHRGLFLTAEMGTGKTMMAISTSFLLCPPKSRTLIMCPGHLVQKWIREIKETIPDAHVVNLNRSGLGMLLELKSTKPTQREYYVLGKEQAKLHYARTSGAASFQHRDHITWTCPRCGSTLDSEPNVRSRRVRCERCKEPLWQADGNRFRRYSKAEYVKRHFPRGKAFNLFIADEVHQYKAGDTAQGQAFAIFCNAAKHTLCLTGTLMGGYSSGLFYLLWRTSPRTMSQIVDYHSIKAFSERYGVTEQVIKTSDKDGRASIGRSSRVTVRERPGISPQILTDLLLERSVFMRLEDVADNLPPFSEYVETVELPSDLAGEYGKFKDALEGEVKRALARGDRSLLGAMLQALLAYPDGARRGEKVLHPTTDDLIAEAPEIPCDVLPKEQRLIEIVQREKEAGRKVLVCLEHTGTRDLIPDLVERLEAAGLKTAALRAT